MQWRVCVDDVQAAWSEHGDTKGGQVGGGGGRFLRISFSFVHVTLLYSSHCFGPL